MSRDRFLTGDQGLVRQINLSAILHHLRERAPVSRAALAEMTGLNRTTVSSLVGELIQSRFIREVGLEEAGTRRGAGRLGMLLALDPAAGCIVSGEIGVDFISAICTNFAPEVIWHRQENIQPDLGQPAIIERTLALLRQAAAAGDRACQRLLGVALGVPGLIDQAAGNLLFAPNLGWKDSPLGALLRQEFSASVFVDNEANLAALGEHYFGAARGCEEVLYISAGVGLGGGLVHGRRLVRGATGVGAEFGHMTLDPDGELCSCGNRGCWETQVSQRALYRQVRQLIESGQASQLAPLAIAGERALTIKAIVQAAEAGDRVACCALEGVGRRLGIGIASLVNALNPELVVLGGSLCLAWKYLSPAVDEEMQRRALPWNREATRIVPAQHGPDACMLGGVAVVYEAILAGPDQAAHFQHL